MANLVDKNQLFHFLSKSPVGLDTTLSKVRNKSGHTLTTDDIFGEEIPACFVPDDVNQLNKIPKSSLNKNDLAAIAYGSSNASYYYYNGSKWVNRSAWQDNELFFNKNSNYLNNGTDYKNASKYDAVIEYHKERFGYFVTDNNNNGSGSDLLSVRVRKNNDTINSNNIVSGDFVSKFLQSTDKFVNGIPSLGYNPLVFNTYSGTMLLEDAEDSGLYISNSYAGVIQFNSKGTEEPGKGYVKDIKISVWEYIGKTLTEVLSGFATVDSGFNYMVAAELPTASVDLKGWVYLVPNSNNDEDINYYEEYICVNKNDKWKWELIGSTKVDLTPYTNHINDDTIHVTPTDKSTWNNHINDDTKHITSTDKSTWDSKIDNVIGDTFIDSYRNANNITLSLNTTEEIIDSDVHVPTSAAVYKHTSDAEIHIPSTTVALTGTDGQTTVGDSCHGFILNVEENTRIERIALLQVNRNGLAVNHNFYCKITDPITDREFISPKFEGKTFYGIPLPQSSVDIVKDGKKVDGVNEVPYLVKGRDYKITFWSSDTHEPISINVSYIEPRQTPNAHFGKFITHRILLSGEVEECSYPDVPEQTGINAFKAAGYAIMFRTRRCDNVHFIDVANEIANVYDALDTNEPNQDVTDHINNTDIHFSKKLITDFGEEKVWDFSLGNDPAGAQGVALAQICADHVLPTNSYVSKITVPQHPNPSPNEITANTPLYLVIYGDTTGSDDWVFVAHSTNTDMQVGGGQDMVFEFEKGTDLGLYKKYRFFYVTDVSTTPQLPITGSGFNGVKMAFPARRINNDNDCRVMNTQGDWQSKYTFPAIISYTTEIPTLHKNNEVKHVTSSEKTSWNNKIDSITGDDFINCEKNDTNVSLSLNATDEIIDSDVHVPTSESIYESLVARTSWEKEPIITEIEDITYNSIDTTSTSSGGGEWGGVCFTPTENIKLTSFTLREIQAIYQSNQSEDVQQTYLKIFIKNEDGTYTLVANNTTKNSTRVTNSTDTTYKYDYTWSVQAIDGGDFIAKAGQEYHVTLNGNYNAASYEIGYKIRFKVYSPNGKDLVLSNIKSIPHTDSNYTPNITLSGKKMSIEIPEIQSGIEEEIPTEFYGEFIRNKHDISHKFDYNITQKQVKSYQDGTVTFADNTKIQYDIFPATIANYAFRQSSTESLRTLEEFNPRVHLGATDTGRNQYFYYERDYYSQKDNGSLMYDDDAPSEGGSAKPLTNLINGSNMFIRSKLSSFNDSLSSLQIGRQMFAQNRHLIEFRSALPSLTYADKMFVGTALTSFRTKLPSLSMAECMFRMCPHLRYVDTCLPNLTFAQGMFGLCINLQRIDLSKNSGISLYNADDMFAGCQSLTHCMLDLSYLETGDNMFGQSGGGKYDTQIGNITIRAANTYGNPKLDVESVKFMCETIKDWKNSFTLNETIDTGNGEITESINTATHKITFGINQSGDSYRNSSETDENNYKFYIQKARKRGWDVTIYYSGGLSEVYPAL